MVSIGTASSVLDGECPDSPGKVLSVKGLSMLRWERLLTPFGILLLFPNNLASFAALLIRYGSISGGGSATAGERDENSGAMVQEDALKNGNTLEQVAMRRD